MYRPILRDLPPWLFDSGLAKLYVAMSRGGWVSPSMHIASFIRGIFVLNECRLQFTLEDDRGKWQTLHNVVMIPIFGLSLGGRQ